MAAAAVQPPQFIDIDRNRFTVIPNPNQGRSPLEHVTKFLETSNGAFRSMQLLQRISSAVSLVLQEMGSSMSAFFDEVGSKLGLAWAMLTIPRLPFVTAKAWKAVAEWNVQEEGPVAGTNRGILEKIHDVADATAAWGYGLSLVFSSSALKNAADVPNFVADVTDLSMASTDYSLAKKHLEHIDANAPQNGNLRQRFVDTMREALLRIVKSVASVVSGALGILVLAFGGPVIPGVALLAISMTSTVAALSTHFFKETRTQEKVDFFKFRTPEVLVGGVRAN